MRDEEYKEFYKTINIELVERILKRFVNLEEVISCFSWNASPDGFDYWNDIYDAIMLESLHPITYENAMATLKRYAEGHYYYVSDGSWKDRVSQ